MLLQRLSLVEEVRASGQDRLAALEQAACSDRRSDQPRPHYGESLVIARRAGFADSVGTVQLS